MKTGLSNLVRSAAIGVTLLALAGCSKNIDSVFRDNMPPEVRLTQAPVSTDDKYFYAYRMNWVGFDPDGRVDHFLIAVDPHRPDSVDASWSQSIKNEEVVFFRATQPDSVGGFINATDFHVFAIAAVDDKGAISKPVWRAFFSFTQAPHVFIESPAPGGAFTPIVTPTVRIRWRGFDLDGQFTTKPIKYKYKLFATRNPDFPGIQDFVSTVLGDPSLIRLWYAPTFGPSLKCPSCSYWDSSSADTTEVQYTNLIPQSIYLFAVTGFDEAGAYDPVFSRDSNLLRFAVTYAGTLGPQICMGNEFFNFCYSSGGYANDPTRYFNVEVPEGEKVTFNWLAIPPEGADIRHYRWVLDLQDLTDETQRTDETNDWYHWSAYSLQTTAASIGPFGVDPPDHLFFIEAEDNNGLRSLGIIRFTVVRATFEHEILFVDDTRLTPDQRTLQGGYAPPVGTWPTAAELDTFFFAKGGYPWKGYPGVGPNGEILNPASYTISAPGVFNGFPFELDRIPPDTLGSRGIITGIVPLARLGRYKLVIWYVDDIGATYSGSPVELLAPTTSLRLMSSPGQPSTISTYLKQGGKVWMFGGGNAYASLQAWQRRNTPADDWTNNDLELIPGRFMYDFPHWQSAVAISRGRLAVLNTTDFSPWPSPALGRGWSGHGLDRNLSQPDYSRLTNDATMGVLRARTCTTDPPSPLRACNSFYLATSYALEYIGRSPTQGSSPPNFIREDADPNPDIIREESTLDTLYLATGNALVNPVPVMTYYHGFQTPQMVFCGFPLWYFQRSQVTKLVDFVMQDIFGYTRSPGATQSTQAARVQGAAPAANVGIVHPAAGSLRR